MYVYGYQKTMSVSKGLAVQRGINRGPVQGVLVSCLTPEAGVVRGPHCALEISAGP